MTIKQPFSHVGFQLASMPGPNFAEVFYLLMDGIEELDAISEDSPPGIIDFKLNSSFFLRAIYREGTVIPILQGDHSDYGTLTISDEFSATGVTIDMRMGPDQPGLIKWQNQLVGLDSPSGFYLPTSLGGLLFTNAWSDVPLSPIEDPAHPIDVPYISIESLVLSCAELMRMPESGEAYRTVKEALAVVEAAKVGLNQAYRQKVLTT